MIPARSPARSTARLLAAATLLLPPGFLAVAAAGASYGFALALAALLAATAAVLLRDTLDTAPRSGDRIARALLWLALFAWLGWIHRTGRHVFGQDVLLVPGIAQALIDTPWVRDAFAATEPGRVYPPGLSILFSPATLLLSGAQQLALWTGITQGVQAALPLLWASALKRWFRVPLDRLSLALILAAVMLCLERTVVLGGSMKNAQHAALGVVLPGVLLLLPRKTGWRPLLTAVLLVAGMASAYYTLLHLLAAIVAGWAVSEIWRRRRLVPRTAWRVAALAGATLAVAPWFVWVVAGLGDDPRLPDPGIGLSERLERMLFAPQEKFWFIFGFTTPDSTGAGVRRLWLLLSLASCLSLSLLAPRLPGVSRRLACGLRSVARLSLAMAIACLALVAMIVMAPLTRLSVDFGRWLIWLPELIVLAGPFLSITLMLRAFAWRRAAATGVPVAMLLLAGGPTHWKDASYVHRIVEERGRSLRSIEALAERLEPSAPCLVVAESKSILNDLFQVGADPLSDVVDVVSRCRLTGGSFLRNPLPGGRATAGLPAGGTLAGWQRDHSLRAIGGEQLIRELRRRQPALVWREERTFSDTPVRLWQAEPRRAAQQGP